MERRFYVTIGNFGEFMNVGVCDCMVCQFCINVSLYGSYRCGRKSNGAALYVKENWDILDFPNTFRITQQSIEFDN
jgi:hypothetical protein